MNSSRSSAVLSLIVLFGLFVSNSFPAAAAISPVNVSIQDYSFSPHSITVVIGVNNTVTWKNNGNTDHTVTANDGSFASNGLLAPGDSYTHSFSTAGTFDYHCTIHSTMTGVVIVKSGSAATTTAASSGGNQGSIPEFPLQGLTVALVTAFIVCFYALARRGSLGKSGMPK